MNRLGAKSFLSPRESIKAFIGLLSQLQNYPDTTFQIIFQEYKFKKIKNQLMMNWYH